MKKVLSTIFYLFIATPVWAQSIDSIEFHNLNSYPLPSVSLVDTAPSISINPGAMNLYSNIDLYISKSIIGNNHISAFSCLGLGNIGYQKFTLSSNLELQRYLLGASVPILDDFQIGMTYNYTQVLKKDLTISSIDLGALYRPSEFLSLGLVIKNVNQPSYTIDNETDSINRVYQAGIGVRPLGNNFSLSLDTIYKEGDPINKINGFLGLELEPLDGIIFRTKFNLDGSFNLNLGLNFSEIGIGYYRNFNSEKVNDGAYIDLSLLPNRTSLTIPNSTVAKLEINNLTSSPYYSFLGNRTLSLWDVLYKIQLIKNDKRYKSVILDIDSLNCGWGTLEELRNAIVDLSKTKETIAYLNTASTSTYYLASGASKIVMPPTGFIGLNGISYVVPYYKGLLDKIGIGVQFERIGKYKSAGETVTNKSMSNEEKEQLNSILDSIYDKITLDISKSRNIPQNKIKEIIDLGLTLPSKAKELNLIDNIGYREEINSLYPDIPKNERIPNRYRKNYSWNSPKIAVLYADGEIVEGKSNNDIFSSSKVIASSTVQSILKQIRENRAIKALILRINSPGGSAIASDEILQELKKFKQNNKPIIISMSDIAASGGYWIACTGDKILSNSCTITGSIGIIFGKLYLQELFKNLDINYEVIKRGKYADAFSIHRPFNSNELNILIDTLKEGYNLFLQRVAIARKKTLDDIEKIAQGRVYTGLQAKELELVDKIGGLEDAILEMKDLLNIPKDKNIELIFFSPYNQKNILIEGYINSMLGMLNLLWLK